MGATSWPNWACRSPDDLITDCVRLCCSLCLLENDPSVIEPDVLCKDRAKFEESGDREVRGQGPPAWQGRLECRAADRSGPALPATAHGFGVDGPGAGGAQVVPRRGSVVHREKVEKVPSGFDA